MCVLSLKLECDKLASEKSEMQRHYVMVKFPWGPGAGVGDPRLPTAKGGLAASPGSGLGAKPLARILGLPGPCCPWLQEEEAAMEASHIQPAIRKEARGKPPPVLLPPGHPARHSLTLP